MARAKGLHSKLALGYESTYGQTPMPAVGYTMPFNQSRLDISQSVIESTTIHGRRELLKPAVGNIDVGGKIVIPIDQIGIGYWLRAMFGDPVTTGADAPYTHVFKVNRNQPSLVLEQQYPDIAAYEVFNGCKVNKFSFVYGGDMELTANLELKGAKRTVGSAPFTAAPTELPLLKFSNFQGTLEEGGTQLGIVTEAGLNLDFGLDVNTYAIGGNGCRTDLPEGVLKISGSITAFFADTVLLNKAISNTKSSLKFKFTSGTHSLDFFMEEVIFQQTSPGIENEKGITVKLPFQAFYDSGASGSAIVATLVNSQDSYAG